jgi:hypothetical protein
MSTFVRPWSWQRIVLGLGGVSVATAGVVAVLQGQAVAWSPESRAPSEPRGAAVVSVRHASSMRWI